MVQTLLCHRQHQLDAVLLIDLGGAGVVIDGGDVGTGVQGANLVHHALALSLIHIFQPCHRVVGSTGKLTGYAYGVEMKQYLLELEQQERCV